MTTPSIRLVQITDFHISADPGERLRGVDTHATLAAVIGRVRAGAPDLVIATGDLSQDGTADSYRRVKALLAGLGAPVYCLAGNHDDPAALAATLAGEGVHVERSVCRGAWQIVFLDSTVAGQDDGRLDDDECAALDAALRARPGLYALVCVHHQPVPVGGAWRDVVSLANPDDLFAVLDRHPQVRGVAWGHIHQPFDAMRGNVRLMGSPATCHQFALGADGGLDRADDPPGYRRIDLEPDGTIATEVCWLDGTDSTQF